MSLNSILASILNVLKGAGNATLNTYKPTAKAAVDRVADKIAGQIAQKTTPEAFYTLLDTELKAAKLPALVISELEVIVLSANVDPAAIGAKGAAAVYDEANRVKALIDGARL